MFTSSDGAGVDHLKEKYKNFKELYRKAILFGQQDGHLPCTYINDHITGKRYEITDRIIELITVDIDAVVKNSSSIDTRSLEQFFSKVDKAWSEAIPALEILATLVDGFIPMRDKTNGLYVQSNDDVLAMMTENGYRGTLFSKKSSDYTSIELDVWGYDFILRNPLGMLFIKNSLSDDELISELVSLGAEIKWR